MMRAALLGVLLAVASCGSRPPALSSYRQPAEGFVISHPSEWTVTDADPARVRIAPPGDAGDGPDFLLILTTRVDHPPGDDEVRVFTVRQIGAYGVSKFQRDARSTGEVAWHRFEVTGGLERSLLAAIGAVAIGPGRARTVVCAGRFETWRTQQKVCDGIVAGFDPGSLK